MIPPPKGSSGGPPCLSAPVIWQPEYPAYSQRYSSCPSMQPAAKPARSSIRRRREIIRRSSRTGGNFPAVRSSLRCATCRPRTDASAQARRRPAAGRGRSRRPRRPNAKQPVNITAQIGSPRARYFPTFPVDLCLIRGGNSDATRLRRSFRERGYGDVVDIANPAVVRRASVNDATAKRPQAAASPDGGVLAPLTAVAAQPWRALAERAIEPNGYYLPDWELAVNASATGRTGVSALSAWSGTPQAQDGTARLIGLMPVISMWRAYRIPLPALVSASPYGTLGTPPLDRDIANQAVARLLAEARKVGARALILRDASLDGAAMNAFGEVLRQHGLRPRTLQSHVRACLDATGDADQLLRDALGSKK